MNNRLWPILFIVVFVASVGAAVALESWAWAIPAIILGAMFANGVVASAEDGEIPRGMAWTIRGIGVAAAAATVWMLWLAVASKSA